MPGEGVCSVELHRWAVQLDAQGYPLRLPNILGGCSFFQQKSWGVWAGSSLFHGCWATALPPLQYNTYLALVCHVVCVWVTDIRAVSYRYCTILQSSHFKVFQILPLMGTALARMQPAWHLLIGFWQHFCQCSCHIDLGVAKLSSATSFPLCVILLKCIGAWFRNADIRAVMVASAMGLRLELPRKNEHALTAH